MSVLGDFVAGVRQKLGNRTDIDDQITGWLKDAYREIAMGFPLETLEVSIQDSTSANNDTYSYPSDARAIKSLIIMNGLSPVPLTKKNIQVVRRYQVNSTGVPSIWAPFGSSSYLMRPVPNSSYPIYLDYWKKPTIDETDVSSINSTLVELPDDWLEILVYNATERGHQSLQEFDKAQAIHTQIHGDPNSQKGWPGLIKERMTRNAAENSVSDFGLRPRIRRYGSVS